MVKINDMAMDSNGNILVTGGYHGNTTLGNFPLVPTGNNQDVFVAKMSDQGVWLWVQTPEQFQNYAPMIMAQNTPQLTPLAIHLALLKLESMWTKVGQQLEKITFL